jgi:hypothetical protein
LLGFTCCASRRRHSFANVAGGYVCVAIALLIVTVGVLATESRLVNVRQSTTSWHTVKISKMVECGGDQMAPLQTTDSRPAPRIVATRPIAYIPPQDAVLPELADAPHEHGLRAPPHA